MVLLLLLSGQMRPASLRAQEPTTNTSTPSPTVEPILVPTPGPSFTPTRSFTETLRSARETATTEAVITLTASAAITDTATPSTTPTPTPGPDDLIDRRIERLIDSMTVADRVGQLFVIEFFGNRVGAGSEIAEMIQEYRVGGIVLRPENNNFDNQAGADTPAQVAVLINQLQALAFGIFLPGSQALNPPSSLLNRPDNLSQSLLLRPSVDLPLLIGVEQQGDGVPTTPLRSGFTRIPPQMALGATWNPTLVEDVGAVVGRELSAVGVNLLLGPNLDVLDQPRPDLVTGIGLHVFGGDAFWVGTLGRAYIRGVHRGGSGRVATIARHFPGQGGTDRRPDDEVATIQKSLSELRRIELPPFAAVTERASAILRTDGDPSATEGLMSGHVRYSSFQGSRERTPPISLATELDTILALEEFALWRAQGGVMMSDALGVPAVQRYYDPTLEEFQRRRISLDAFQAGNDLLYLSRFSSDGSWVESRANVKETILFFRERYTSDPEFAALVDESLHRILRLKLGLYPLAQESGSSRTGDPVRATGFQLSNVLVARANLRVLVGPAKEEADATVNQVAREAVTILHPDPQGLTDPLPAAPQPEERVLIISDERPLQDCLSCPAEEAIPVTALEEIMLRFYGPDATGQLTPNQVSSIGFGDLNGLLNESLSGAFAQQIEQAIEEADWLIFAMLDLDPAAYEASDVVKQFLRLRTDRLRGKRILVLSFSEPFYLDATEISKLTVYLGLYSKTQPFREAGIRAIFRALAPQGAPPVSVPGTRFRNLIERLEPDPNRRIDLTILNEEVITTEAADGEVIVEEADLDFGDVLEIEAGPILDKNGNPVPDGTMVDFRLVYDDEDLARSVEPVPTFNGLARVAVPLDPEKFALRVSASSVDATVSTIIRVDERAQVSISNPTSTPVPTPIDTPAASPFELGEETTVPPRPGARVDILTLVVAGTTQMVVLALLLVVLVRVMPRFLLVSRLLWATLIGWLAYILYGLGLVPGGSWLQLNFYPWGAAPVVLIGMLIPLVWLQLRTE